MFSPAVRTESIPLSDKRVDRIWARLAIRYAVAWLRMWEGFDEKAAKADWARELGSVPDSRIQWALDHLPGDRPPNVSQFKALCQQAPSPSYYALPGRPRAKVDPAKRAEVMRQVSTALASSGDRLTQARHLRQREEAGDKTLTFAQKDFWRSALAREIAMESAA